MPWTFSHPAAVLPLRSLGAVQFPLVPLMLGSLTPDFGYYLGSSGAARLAHSFTGVFVFCLPAGLLSLALLSVLWRLIIHLLPNPHRAALETLSAPSFPFNGKAFCVTSTAIVLGALTHVVWDSFTHATGEAVARIVFLREHLFTLGGRDVAVYALLQHLSTLAGAALLIITYVRWLRVAAPGAKRDAVDMKRYGIITACMLGAVAAGMMAAHVSLEKVGNPLSLFVFRSIIYSTNVFLVLFLAAAVLWGRACLHRPSSSGNHSDPDS